MADLPDLSRCRPISVTSSSSSKPAPFATGGHHCDRSMELATGALPSVLAKLSDLLVGEYKLPKGLMGKEEITFLQAELENMHGTLEEFAARPAHRVEEVQRFWAWRVKDLSYDIEDIIDTFMVGGKGGKLAKPHVFKKFIERSHYNRNRFAIDMMMSRVKDLSHRCNRYFPDRYHSKISIKNDVIKSAKIDPGKFHRPMDVTEPVGIEKARDELINILSKYNIASIYGMGGVGKTTLAITVYKKLRSQFDCSAFISVSRSFDMKLFLKSMVAQFSIKNISDINEELLTLEVIREFLQTKRYLFIVDDIWDILSWKKIICALPINNGGCVIITTTRFLDIAEQVGRPYKLKPLSLDDSRILFYKRISGNEDNYIFHDEELAQVSHRILEKCAGVPLSIIMVTSLLASKGWNKTECFELYNNSIGTGMMKILAYCYYDLPFYLRTCLLYVSIFPEDFEIEKDRLIWLWIAEGFIQNKEQGKNLFELGENYFNELINRGFIQPMSERNDAEICYYRVHDSVWDLIRSLSNKENFITVLDDSSQLAPSTNFRRLSLQNCKVDHVMPGANVSWKRLRSVVAFPSSANVVPTLQSFKVLRVLDLQDCSISKGSALNYLGNLFQLRYLGLKNTHTDKLPQEIENLQFLQTLDIRGNRIFTLPPTVVQLACLIRLRVDGITRVPNGIRSLSSLEDMSRLCISSETTQIIEELAHLTNLRVLHILYNGEWNSSSGKCLVQSLCKLEKIQSLCIDVPSHCNFDSWDPPRPLHLRTLELRGCWFSTLPNWMYDSLLLDLCFLSISKRKLQQEDLEILGRLPALRHLRLTVDHENIGIIGKFVVATGSFPCLIQCELIGFIIPVLFQQGAMSRLASLKFTLLVRGMREIADRDCGFNIGLGNLLSLQDVTVFLNRGNASEKDVDQARAAVMQAARMHPFIPIFRFEDDTRDVKCHWEEANVGITHVTEMHPCDPTLQITADERDVQSHGKDVCEQSDRYKLDDVISRPHRITTVYPSLLAQYMQPTELVGIDKAINEAIKILMEGYEVSNQQGKIVSLVGFVGLGKTTLAKAVYEKIREQFDCWGFISVARKTDMKKLFKSMLSQLGKKTNSPNYEEELDERHYIYELTELLHNKRYLIVIDGIWDISVWKMIRFALPDNNCGYRIITTTHKLDIAEKVGDAYKLESLSLKSSKILLTRRIFDNKDRDKGLDEQLVEVCDKILKKCGGVPLAIILISGLLASKGRNKIEWYKVYDSIGTGLEDRLDMDNMKKILSLSYYDLPSHLKNCLLYLSMFPEDYNINKDRLIRLWIAEGFIQCGKQGDSLFELGETYFSDLIIRGMILPVYKRWYYDVTEYFHVHGMVLDLICYLSSNENHVTILDYMHGTLPLMGVRRLSFQNCMVSHATHRVTMSMEKVTSVFVFPSAINLMPALLSFRDLHVLDLQSCQLSRGCSLKYLGNLFHLRYLGLRDTGITQLSEEMGNLQSLQTLDVTSNEISSLPPTVVQLKDLMCLSIDSWTRVPNGIGSLTSLEELSMLCINDSTDLVEELVQLTELRMVGIDYQATWNVDSLEKSLVGCLHKLQKVQTLSLSVFGEYKLDSWVAPQHIRRLELKGCLSSPLQTWMNPSLLLDLSFLSMEVQKLRQEDLEILGRLPSLIYLDLEVCQQNLGRVRRFVVIVGDCSFPCLVQCMLRGYIAPVVFQQGAMPRLARLHQTLPLRQMRETADINGAFDLGLENLLSLQDATFLVHRGGTIEADVEEAQAALRHAIGSHPNHPALEIYTNDV